MLQKTTYSRQFSSHMPIKNNKFKAKKDYDGH